MLRIDNHQTITYFPTRKKAVALATNFLADDNETNYRVVEAFLGFYVAIFEDGVQVHTL